jgi:amino acid transporter
MWYSYDNTQTIRKHKKLAVDCFMRAGGLLIGVSLWMLLAKVFSPSIVFDMMLVIWCLSSIIYISVGLCYTILARKYEKLDKETNAIL